MRVVGYVRESADPSAGLPAFSQQELLRRHAEERGHRLVAICQDLRDPGHPVGRDGYLSLLGVVASGGVDAVVVPDLSTFSSDAIVQEIVLWDLRSRGVRVISTADDDTVVLDPDRPPDPSRLLIRDVLQRVEEHATGLESATPERLDVMPDGDVYVQILEADSTE
jgi:DNA invertase Pin-like site-specific DNA recombinase